MKKLFFSVFISFTIVYSNPGFSGCTPEEETECHQFKNGKLLKSFKCNFSTCGNVHGSSFGYEWHNNSMRVYNADDATYPNGAEFNEKRAHHFRKKIWIVLD